VSQNNQTFEENMQRLELIVRKMEQGDVPLEESLKLFQEGTDLVRKCTELLDNAKLQVQLVTNGPDGLPVEEDFGVEL
jgi:exodeoxyribonuclease VII small subunit